MSVKEIQPADEAVRHQAEVFAAVVGPHVERGQPYALLDFPSHSNIGDSAIYAGQLAFLDAHVGRRASCVCTCTADLEWLDGTLPADGPILLHGGGNFGDLWPHHQKFRHAMLQRYRGRKIVQLAQSIHYGDSAGLDLTARLIESHGNFTLLVRDQPSYDLARARFNCNVQLCPDAAMVLLKLDPGRAPEMDTLVMLRKDHEAVHDDIRSWLEEAGYPIEDWNDTPVWTLPIRVGWKAARTFPNSRISMMYREAMYRHQAMRRVMTGVRQLARAKRIVADRLHVHLLSLLLRQPHLVLDNSYGKISRYIDTWGQDDLTTRISSLDMLQAALARPPR